jgi:hypothetical protein
MTPRAIEEMGLITKRDDTIPICACARGKKGIMLFNVNAVGHCFDPFSSLTISLCQYPSKKGPKNNDVYKKGPSKKTDIRPKHNGFREASDPLAEATLFQDEVVAMGPGLHRDHEIVRRTSAGRAASLSGPQWHF